MRHRWNSSVGFEPDGDWHHVVARSGTLIDSFATPPLDDRTTRKPYTGSKNMTTTRQINRRQFLNQAGYTGAGLLTASMAMPHTAVASPGHSEAALPIGKAEHCIMIWLGGGSCHIDTWDPKRRGDAKAKKPGSSYDPIDTAIAGTQLCEHLPRCAQVLDRFNIVRTVHHEVIDEHAAATNRMHTGRPTSGTITYPSVGSIVAHRRGPVSDTAPATVLIDYPNVMRGPGFLGAQAGYIYLTDTRTGPAGLSRPADIGRSRQDRRERLLAKMRADYRQRTHGGLTIRDYDTTVSEALRLSAPNFMNVFQLDGESATWRESYGGEFGLRCLLSRRLLQAGVRFVEVSHNLNFVNGTGWDTHNEG